MTDSDETGEDDIQIPKGERRKLTEEVNEYNDDYIRTKVYGRKDGDYYSDRAAKVEVWSGRPPTGKFGINLGTTERLRTWVVQLNEPEFEDELEDALEAAKSYCDDRKTDKYVAWESTKIATERAFSEGVDD